MKINAAIWTYFTSFLLCTGLASAAITQNSTAYPTARNVEWSNVAVGPMRSGGAYVAANIGVDIWMQNSGINGNSAYLPCQQPINFEPYAGACLSATSISYYNNLTANIDGTTNCPFGISIDNKNNGYQNRGQKTTGAALEAYPHYFNNSSGRSGPIPCYPYAAPKSLDPTAVGGARISVDSFPNDGGGGAYSIDYGTIRLPKYSEPGVVMLNGFATKNGVTTNALSINVFGQSTVTDRSSTGAKIAAFSSGHSKMDGYYNSGPLIGGSAKLFTIYFTDTENGNTVTCTQV